MREPYIVLGGLEIPYTLNEYERHGTKAQTTFESLTGQKKFYYLKNNLSNILERYTFTLRTMYTGDVFDIQKLFAIQGSLYLVDFTPIVEMKNMDGDICYLNRAPLEDIEKTKIVTESGTSFTPVFTNSGTPGQGEAYIYTDGSQKIVFSSSIDGAVFIQYVPQFKVSIREDPIFKWVKDEIYYLSIELEEV